VATIAAQAAFASDGRISGSGLAIAKIIGSFAILLTISLVTNQALDTHIKTSAHSNASSKVQAYQSKFVISVICSFILFKLSLHLYIGHLESNKIQCFNQ